MSGELPARATRIEELERQAEVILHSGSAPQSVTSKEQVMAIALKGQEAGVPIMQALAHIHVINGQPTMSAELMTALARRAGHKVRVIETDQHHATVQGVRADDPDYPLTITYTIEEAEEAGLLKNPVWRKYRPAMLRARATAALCRAVFSDTLSGISYLPEEMGESGFNQLAPEGVEVTELDHSEHASVLSLIYDYITDLYELAEKGYAEEPDRSQILEYALQSTAKAERMLDRLRELADEAETKERKGGEQ